MDLGKINKSNNEYKKNKNKTAWWWLEEKKKMLYSNGILEGLKMVGFAIDS